MCGILGLFHLDGIEAYHHALLSANNIISHRGPDGEGQACFDSHNGRLVRIIRNEQPQHITPPQEFFNLAIAHRRLAIIDLSREGLQPMSTADNSIWITYNGEIYNYIEIKNELEAIGHTFRSQTDTEVILAAYKEWGIECVHRFNGMWAFTIVDLERRKLFCCRDRFGIKPFHYFFNRNGFFAFASEIKQLLEFPFIHREMNLQTVYNYLKYQLVETGEETFFSGIFNLLPGHLGIFDLSTGKFETQRYYDPLFQINEDISARDAAEKFRYLLRDSVRLRLRSDVAIGSCLSGGLDSSSIVCLIDQIHKSKYIFGKQQTYSCHFDEKEANELVYMQEVVNRTGVRAHYTTPAFPDLMKDLEKLVWHQEEPFGSTSIFAQWSVFKLVSENGTKVMLDGQGADEILAGYIILYKHLFKEYFAKKEFKKLLFEFLAYIKMHQTPESIMRILLSGIYTRSKSILGSDCNWISDDLENKSQGIGFDFRNTEKVPFGKSDYLNNTLHQLTFKTSLPALLKYEDRNSMAFSVESRVPFLDYRLVEFLFSLPPNRKIGGCFTKRVLRDGMAGVLPEKIRQRVNKIGFATPEQTWQNGEMRQHILNTINTDCMRPFIKPKKAMEYLEFIRKTNRLDFTPWLWINLYQWIQQFHLSA